MADPAPGGVVALSGGIGGAKLALGLYRALPPDTLTVIANPGDDFEHLGLTICPDLDTLLYTLAGIADPERGWGLAGETWHAMEALERLGGETWFRLGDRDLATHLERTRRLRAGERPSTIARAFAVRLGIAARVLPATDEPVRTVVETRDEGDLPFQRYFVERRCEPAVAGFRFEGAACARPSPEVRAALAQPGLRAIGICPSNPFISVDPILAVPGMREAIREAGAPVIAVSPLIGGQAVKGPTAKMLDELGLERGPGAIAAHYAGLAEGLVVDTADAETAAGLGIPVRAVPTLMRTDADKARLAREVLAFADALRAA